MILKLADNSNERGVNLISFQRSSKLILAAFVLVAALVAFLLSPSQVSADPDHVTLTWTGDPQTTQTITWRTDFSLTPGLVQYNEVMNNGLFPQGALTSAAEVQGLSTNAGNMSIHSATLTGLKAGTRYIYRVGDGIHWSKQHYFTTAADNAQSFKFLIFGDSQSINYFAWRSTLHTAYQANRDAAFFINVGDLVDVGQNYNEWNAWFNASQGVIDTIPVVPVVGNHETYTPERTYSMPVFFTAQLKVPANGPEGLIGQVYSFDYGNVHFSVLDSQAGEEREFAPDMLEKQKVWLEHDLKTTNKIWKIVIIHRPLYHNRPQDSDGDLREAFIPLIDKYKVDIVFSGHDHVYARSYPLRNGSIAGSQTDGTIYLTAGRSGTKTYKSALAKEYNEVFHNPADEPNYITVEVNGGAIIAKVFKRNGFLIDEWLIRK